MKKIISNLTSLFIIGVFFLFLTNCSEEGKSDSDLVGIWNVTNVDYDASVGNMTVEDYYLNELELTPEETIPTKTNTNNPKELTNSNSLKSSKSSS